MGAVASFTRAALILDKIELTAAGAFGVETLWWSPINIGVLGIGLLLERYNQQS